MNPLVRMTVIGSLLALAMPAMASETREPRLPWGQRFVIGPEGRIRYGLYAGLEWDRDDLVASLEALLPRP